MGVIRRQRQQVGLKLSAPSVQDAVATMRTRREQAREHNLRLKVSDDGGLMARIPGGRYSSPPRLEGRFEPGDGGIVFEGVISESHASVGIPRGFIGMAVFLALGAILVAVGGQPSPGSYICGVSAVLFALIGYAMGRLRGSTFSYDCRELMRRLTPLMPGARPLGEGAAGRSRGRADLSPDWPAG